MTCRVHVATSSDSTQQWAMQSTTPILKMRVFRAEVTKSLPFAPADRAVIMLSDHGRQLHRIFSHQFCNLLGLTIHLESRQGPDLTLLCQVLQKTPGSSSVAAVAVNSRINLTCKIALVSSLTYLYSRKSNTFNFTASGLDVCGRMQTLACLGDGCTPRKWIYKQALNAC